MSQINDLSNHFLIAMPNLMDPNFSHGVTYMCEHNEEGALGILINQPLGLYLGDIFMQMGINSTNQDVKELPVLFGGPIHPDRGFIIHRPTGIWRSSLEITPDITVTTSQDILEAIAMGGGPNEFLIALGYAGWAHNQLEQEMANNTWLSCTASNDILFKTPIHKRWEAAAALIGIDINSLSSDIGHA